MSDPTCYTVVFESSADYPSATELRSGLEKGSDDVKLDTLRKIIVSIINGNPQVCRLDPRVHGTVPLTFRPLAHVDDANHPIRFTFA